MPQNKGYLTARTNKASDEVFTPAYAVKPILKYITMKDYHDYNLQNALNFNFYYILLKRINRF